MARTVVAALTFNADLATDGLADHVRLLGPEGNAIACAVSTAGSTMTIAPKAALPGDTLFTLDADASVADTTARTLGAPLSSKFSTVAQAWPAIVTDVGTLAAFTAGTAPALVALPSGGLAMAWQDNYVVRACCRVGVTGAWSTPVTLNTNMAAGPVRIAVCPNDDAVVFWSELVSGESTARGARFIASSNTWTSLGVVPVAPFGGSIVSAVADSKGNVTVASSNGVALYVARWDAATVAWGALLRVDHPVATPYVLGMHLAINAADAIVGTWIQVDDDGMSRSVFVTRFDPATGQWSAAQRAGSTAQQYLSVAMDDSGVVTLAWATASTLSTEPSIWSVRQTSPAATWSSPVRLDTDSVFGSGAPVLAADPAGRVTAAWVQEGTLHAAFFYPVAGTWRAAVQVSSVLIAGTPALALACDVCGNATALMVEAQNRPMAWRYAATTGRWQSGTPIGAPAQGGIAVFANDAVAVVDRTGNVSAAWFAWNRIGGVNSYTVSVSSYQ